MGLDATRYRDEVITPWSKDAARAGLLRSALADAKEGKDTYKTLDLPTLYAIPHSGVDVRVHEEELFKAYNKWSRKPASPLLKELWQVLSSSIDGFHQPAFWDDFRRERDQLREEKLVSEVKTLASYAPLAVALTDEVAGQMAALGFPDLSEAKLKQVFADQGIILTDPVEPPVHPLPGPVEKGWAAAAKHVEYHTILDLILLHIGRVDGVRFLDRLERKGTAIGMRDVEESLAASKRGRDSNALQSAQKVLGSMVKEVDGSTLRAVVFHTIAQQVLRDLKNHLPPPRVKDDLVRHGIDAVDAGRIVLWAQGQSTSSQTVSRETVTDHIAHGRLDAARMAVEALAADPDQAQEADSLAQRIEQLRRRKDQHVATYRAALQRRDQMEAARELNDALAIDAEDEHLQELLEQLPPEAPQNLAVKVEGSAVRLEWSSSGSGVQYALVRAHRPPEIPGHGEQLQSGTRLSFVDERPVVGRKIVYAVFAFRESGQYSEPVMREVLVRPPVRSLSVNTGEDAVGLRWQLPEEADGVQVSVAAASGRSEEQKLNKTSNHTVRGLTPGQTYVFTVRALYSLPGGVELSDGVSIKATPRREAVPIQDVRVQEIGDDGRVIVSWSPPDDTVEFWSFDGAHDLRPGDRVGAERLRELGAVPLPHIAEARQRDRCWARLDRFPGVRQLLPLVPELPGYLVGSSTVGGSVAQPENTHVEVLGDQIRLSWNWPEAASGIRVSWVSEGASQARRVSRSLYDKDGGVWLPADVTDLALASEAQVGGRSWVSPPATVEYAPSTSVTLRYQLALRRRFMKGHLCEVTVSGPPNHDVSCVLGVSQGQFMPASVEQTGQKHPVILRLDETGSGSTEIELGKHKSPFWVRLFADSCDVTLLDPPTNQMKG